MTDTLHKVGHKVGVEYRVLAQIHKAADLVCLVRTVEVDVILFVELRDYIPSLGEMGRGYILPADAQTRRQLIEALTNV